MSNSAGDNNLESQCANVIVFRRINEKCNKNAENGKVGSQVDGDVATGDGHCAVWISPVDDAGSSLLFP